MEKVKPEWILPEYKKDWDVRRQTSEGGRFYYRFDQDGKLIKAYISITNLAGKLIPKGAGYHVWLKKFGDKADGYRQERAVFGSLFHQEAIRPIVGDSRIHGHGYDFDWLDEVVDHRRGLTNFHLMIDPEWRHKAEEWRRPFKKGLLSWFSFVKEKVKKVIAVEFPIISDLYGIAGQIDFVHVSEYYRKDRVCITDIKSFLFNLVDNEVTKKSFFETHEFQLATCQVLWNDAFPDSPVTHVFNWAPNAWTKEPTYTWKYQGKSQFLEIAPGDDRPLIYTYFDLAKKKGLVAPPSKVLDVKGKLENVWDWDAKDYIVDNQISES